MVNPVPLFALSLALLTSDGDPTIATSSEGDAPPARALSLGLTAQTRLAGTTGSHWGALFVQRELQRAGWEVELDAREVVLSLPRKLGIMAFADGESLEPIFERTRRFDPDANPPGDVPPFNAWSASGRVDAPVIDAGHGLRADFEGLIAAGIDPRGTIALARYGGSYRGVKARLAEEYGCAGMLLFSDPAGDGAAKGPVWPEGPWKPDWAVQRGSISPLAMGPGDPSTPGWASPAPGEKGRRLTPEEYAQRLPKILCLPIPAREALVLIENLAPLPSAESTASDEGSDDDEQVAPRPVGPGPVHVRIDIDQPRELRTIYNVIARLYGYEEGLVIAGNHRDAWVRGAQDAGSGTVALLRCAQHLGELAESGWRPRHTIQLSFWDAEESGLIGSTEWAEANATELKRNCIAYVNGDAVVSGTKFRGASGTPGLLASLRAALEQVPRAVEQGNLWEEWVAAAGERGPRLGLPGSGSDYTVFLHHLSIPVLDIGFGGNGGGQYHTSFDNFAQIDRFLDPTWRGHETAGLLFSSLLTVLSERGFAAFDEAQAASAMAAHARRHSDWLGEARAERLAAAFEEVALAPRPDPSPSARFYPRLAANEGLPGRPWFKNRLWAPGLDTGYSSEIFPTLRSAAADGERALDLELNSLIDALRSTLSEE